MFPSPSISIPPPPYPLTPSFRFNCLTSRGVQRKSLGGGDTKLGDGERIWRNVDFFVKQNPTKGGGGGEGLSPPPRSVRLFCYVDKSSQLLTKLNKESEFHHRSLSALLTSLRLKLFTFSLPLIFLWSILIHENANAKWSANFIEYKWQNILWLTFHTFLICNI